VSGESVSGTLAGLTTDSPLTDSSLTLLMLPGIAAPLALVWQPIASPRHIVGGAAVLVALAVFAYVRVWRDRPRISLVLLGMRLVVIAAVALLMFGPSRELSNSPHDDRSRLTVLLDTSESMLTGDCEGSTRIECVARDVLSLPQLHALQEQFDVDLRGFDETVRSLPIARLHQSPADLATGRATHLAEAVSSSLSQITSLDDGDALLVVSDGRDTEDAPMQPAATLATSKGVPIFAVGVGGAQSSVDAALLAVPMQESLLPGEPGGIRVKVYQSGLDGGTSVVRLKSGGETQSSPIEFGDGQVAEVQLNVQREEPGQYEFEVSLDPVAGETDLANNSQTVFVEVMKRRIRVLVLEGEPFWDSKFLAQSLRKDEQVELTQITQVGQTKQEKIVTRVEGTSPAVPRTADEWAEYDIVVLGRSVERLLDETSAKALAGFVSDGGGHVVFARGRAWDPSTTEGERIGRALAILEPVEWGDAPLESLSLSLTPSGRTAAWFAATKMGTDAATALEKLPGFEAMSTIEREKSGTLVLARAHGSGPAAEGLPAITRMNYGRGQVIAILGEGLWRWGLLPPELQELRGFYDTFWSNLVRWLALGGDFAPGQQVSLQLSRTSARLGDEMTIDVVYKQPPSTGAGPQLELLGPDGESLPVALHELPGQSPRFRATVTPEVTGVHRVAVRAPGMTPAQLDRKFNVYEVNLERLQTSANFLALRMLAEHSGGAMFDVSNAGDLRDQLQRHRAAMLVPPQLEYLWDHGLIMTLLLVWAGVEWLLRRAAGLW
jgi:hypothetical protein